MRSKQILVVLTLLCVMTVPAIAVPESAVIGIGDGSGTVTIPITVTNAENVGSMDLMLKYDPTIVNVTSVANGDMDNTITNLENTANGWIHIVAYQAGSDVLSGTFILANIDFEAVGSSGSCPLEISVTTFKDATPAGNVMPYTVSNGTYTISYTSSSSSRSGTYPPEYSGENYSSTGNVTEEEAENETALPESIAPPVKTLPGSEPVDTKDGKSTNWIFVGLALGAALVAAYLIKRKRT